jgi:hypothetical protein
VKIGEVGGDGGVKIGGDGGVNIDSLVTLKEEGLSFVVAENLFKRLSLE